MVADGGAGGGIGSEMRFGDFLLPPAFLSPLLLLFSGHVCALWLVQSLPPWLKMAPEAILPVKHLLLPLSAVQPREPASESGAVGIGCLETGWECCKLRVCRGGFPIQGSSPEELVDRLPVAIEKQRGGCGRAEAPPWEVQLRGRMLGLFGMEGTSDSATQDWGAWEERGQSLEEALWTQF